jgi:muramidase (phage lysozyme)
MFKLNLEIKLGSKQEPKERSPTAAHTYVAAVPRRQINWGAIAITGLIIYGSYRGYQSIKPTLDAINSAKAWIESVTNFEIEKKSEFSLNYLEIGNPQPKLNQYVGGYRISSLRGWRTHPVTGAKNSWHDGVDVATPIGTSTYAIAPGTNECKNQPAGAGKYAEFTFAGGNWQARYFHLSSCTPGKFQTGQVIAKSGNTGRSTGPHSHIELRKKTESGWEAIDPSSALIKYSFQPFSVTPKNRYDGTKVATNGLNPKVAAFLDAIAYTEGTLREDGYEILYGFEHFDDFSKHPNKVICKPHNGRKLCSSAAGRYQFLTSTWNEVKQDDFSPRSQDRAAIELLEKRNILPLVKNGQTALAFHKARYTWASFPGNSYNQKQVPLGELLKFYNERLEVYK